MIVIKNVNKSFASKMILKDINLKFPSSGLVIIKGTNGSGKSTLLNLIGGIDHPDSGEIQMNDFSLTGKKENVLTKYREENISFIFQDNNLFENLSVIDNVAIVGNNENISIKKVIELLDLSKLINVKVKKLSGGEKQRVAIARAIVKGSKIVLADEPTSSLDYETKVRIYNCLYSMSKHSLVIMVSHDSEEFDKYADILVTLNNGEVSSVLNLKKSDNNVEQTAFKNRFNSVKFSFKNMFLNKKKVIFSSLVLIFSFLFLLFSISLSTLNLKQVHKSAMKIEADDLFLFKKYDYIDNQYMPASKFDSNDIDYLANNKISKSNLILGESINIYGVPINFKIKYQYNESNPYYRHFDMRLSFLSANCSDLRLLGSCPKYSNELVVSSYLADLMIRYGVMKLNEEYFVPKDYSDIIDNSELLYLGGKGVKIVGIYEVDLNKYDSLKNGEINEKNIDNLSDSLSSVIDNIASNVYVSPSFFDIYSDINSTISSEYYFSLFEMQVPNKKEFISNPQLFSGSVQLKNGHTIETLSNNEIVINQEILKELELNEETCIGSPINLFVKSNFGLNIEENLQYTVIGISNDDNYYVSKGSLEKYLDNRQYVNKIFLYESDDNVINQIFDRFSINDGEYRIVTNYSWKIYALTNFQQILSKIFIVVSSVFFLFSIILLINYIINSIDNHKKDIAILKSLGISYSGVKQIFMTELASLLIASYVIAVLLFFILKVLLNDLATSILTFKAEIINLPISLLLVVFVSIWILIWILSIIIHKKINYNAPQYIYKTN